MREADREREREGDKDRERGKEREKGSHMFRRRDTPFLSLPFPVHSFTF